MPCPIYIAIAPCIKWKGRSDIAHIEYVGRHGHGARLEMRERWHWGDLLPTISVVGASAAVELAKREEQTTPAA